jgi:hypothetical protein
MESYGVQALLKCAQCIISSRVYPTSAPDKRKSRWVGVWTDLDLGMRWPAKAQKSHTALPATLHAVFA